MLKKISFVVLGVCLISSLVSAKEPLPRSDCFWGLHFDLHPQPTDNLGADLSEANIRQLIDRVKPDYVQYDCKGHAGYLGYPSEVSKNAPIANDSLALWRKITLDNGIGLFIHFSGVWDSLAVSEHPEWAAVNPEGKPSDSATSAFGPYVDERMIPQLKEATSKYQLNGLWVDGECWAAKWDYSKAALDAWKKETGFETAPKDSKEPHWLEWKEFQRKQFRQYLKHWVDEMHKFNPKLQITSNWMFTTLAPIPMDVNLDYISGDYSPQNSLYNVRLDARYIPNIGKSWDLMAWGFAKGSGQEWSIKPAVQLEQEAGAVLMQGGGFQIYNQPTRTGYIIEPMIDCLAEVGDFVRARKDFCYKSKSIPQVALLLSSDTFLDRSNSVYSGGENDEIRGILDAFIDLQYSVDVLAEHQLQSRMKEFPLIVIPSATKLKKEFVDALDQYVKEGGSLLVIGSETAPLFKDQLGVKLTGDPAKKVGELKSSLGTTSVTGNWQTVELAGATAVGYAYSTRDVRKEGWIAASMNNRGKGKIAGIYAPVAIAYNNGHQPQLRQFIGEIAWRLFPDPKVTIKGVKNLEISLRHNQDGKDSLHLLNYTGAPNSDRFSFTDFIPPIGPFTVTIKVDKEPKNVVLQPSKAKIDWKYKDGVVTAQIPKVDIYEILTIE